MHETRPWHQLVMICPTCGQSFQPEIVGLHVRLCPQCEEVKNRYERLVHPPSGAYRSCFEFVPVDLG